MAKELNYALLEKAQYFLSNAQLDKSFWDEALIYSSHLMNRLSVFARGGKTPLKFWLGGADQDYGLLWVFEYPVYFHVKEDKLDPRAKEFVFLGVKRNLKGYNM